MRGPALELTAATAPGYLARRGFAPKWLNISELAGGVSNTVLLVESDLGRFVLKQSLPKLRVSQEWLSDRRRILREASALQALAPDLPQRAVPEVLFRDDENYLFAMSAAQEGSETWKAALLRGECDPEIAARAGAVLGALIKAGWRSESMRAAFGDIAVFHELRLDPYYQTTAARHPDLKIFFDRLVHGYASRACTLTHGDWSPKNILVRGKEIMVIDFEVIHWGDPGFDSAFLLNHLLLKSFYLPQKAGELRVLAAEFWTSLGRHMPSIDNFERSTIEHLGALLLSRIDGKSPVEYIQDPALRDRIRRFARHLILNPPGTVSEVFAW